MPADCAVAFADRRRLPLERLASLLSSRERAEVSTYTCLDRRWRTITSRLLTKYLLAEPGAQQFQEVGAREIDAVGRRALASIEHLSGVAGARTTPAIIQEGHDCSSVSASSSHCGPYTASCLGGHSVGLDLERIEEHRREFYEHAFSSEEQEWARWMGAAGGGSPEAAFTFLWTVKEAFLKASRRHDVSVWSFPHWTVRAGESVRQILRPNAPKELLKVSVGMRGPGFSAVFELASMRINDMILCGMQY